MAGFGCCTEGGTFGGGDSKAEQRGGEDPQCSPFSIPPFDAPNLSLGTEKWPQWMVDSGCGYISIMMHDQIVHGKDKVFAEVCW